jgi:D-alanine-D-alanine ligase
MSARSVLSVLDPERYEVTQVGITKDGRWFTGEDAISALETGVTEELEHVILSPDPSEQGLYVLQETQYKKLTDIDVFFPVMHGTYSEDGTMQGLLEMADVAYVGAGVAGAAVGMDKGIFKDVMVANNIPVVDTLVVLRREIEEDMEAVIRRAEEMSAYPIFTKPANLGSSVGVTKCNNRSDLQEGLFEAAAYDRRVLVQLGIKNVREMIRRPLCLARWFPAASSILTNPNTWTVPQDCSSRLPCQMKPQISSVKLPCARIRPSIAQAWRVWTS